MIQQMTIIGMLFIILKKAINMVQLLSSLSCVASVGVEHNNLLIF